MSLRGSRKPRRSRVLPRAAAGPRENPIEWEGVAIGLVAGIGLIAGLGYLLVRSTISKASDAVNSAIQSVTPTGTVSVGGDGNPSLPPGWSWGDGGTPLVTPAPGAVMHADLIPPTGGVTFFTVQILVSAVADGKITGQVQLITPSNQAAVTTAGGISMGDSLTFLAKTLY